MESGRSTYALNPPGALERANISGMAWLTFVRIVVKLKQHAAFWYIRNTGYRG